ncbi:MAG: N-acetylmuramoyl-L-alanine amidase [Roseobacter sp.]|jgi:N-acetylmuramoyl-L-alanine amidase|uniref:N-acetylmuramoyl-L-alanine amidase n=1 Tax=Maribacter flavus TaxID=1658664 RepID=A0A5B2TYH1_9FLAO|nr:MULTISPECIES: N-acetylmuramoyl-L-alanine amidase [Flavobacteriaceae]KAA2218720.1 N-acetylmuramoyl-L-alanine amidase [Maribacter flavus]MEE4189891.1 N-acetylmuramoyl-L-alanine amidase [Roseobacter sp.]
MKKWLKNVSFVFLLLKSCLLLGQDLDEKKIIVIDPGHGGNDSGAIGVNSLREKKITLEIVRLISELAEKNYNKTVEIYQTRYSDTLVSLSDRAKLAKVLNADLFLSLHCNHSDNPDARGVEVYVPNKRLKFLDEATWFGFQLQAELNEKLGFESRGVKFANFQVLRETTDYMPSILLELGFVSNEDEQGYLLKPESLNAVALVIWECLIKNIDSYERVGD